MDVSPVSRDAVYQRGRVKLARWVNTAFYIAEKVSSILESETFIPCFFSALPRRTIGVHTMENTTKKMAACSVCEETSQDSFVIVAARLWDGLSDACTFDPDGLAMCVVVVPPHIAWIGRFDLLPEQYSSLRAFDYTSEDATVMPGLIDSHIHIEFDPSYPLHGQPQLSEATILEHAKKRARAMVAHGITCARDLGGKGVALKLRDAIKNGECVGPRLLCAGQPITRPGGHCHQWGGEASGEAAITAVVERQARSGVRSHRLNRRRPPHRVRDRQRPVLPALHTRLSRFIPLGLADGPDQDDGY